MDAIYKLIWLRQSQSQHNLSRIKFVCFFMILELFFKLIFFVSCFWIRIRILYSHIHSYTRNHTRLF